jgi:UDP-galactopyranose mutase
VTAAAPGSTAHFRSYWQAGFESACHITRAGARLDLLAATQHDRLAREDYRRLQAFGIRTVREAVRWHLVDRRGQYDFRSLRPLAEAARAEGVEVLWTLCHYGWPDDLDLLTPRFVDRFARYARATAECLAGHDDGTLYITPVNEISFMAWAAGARGVMYPFAEAPAPAIKRQLVRATIAAIDAIRDVVPGARFLHVDPLIHVVAPRDRPELTAAARAESASQFESVELLCGALEPELGGHPRYLDLLGLNYYHANQWELGNRRLRWEDHPRDSRWVPLHQLLAGVWRKFERPLVITETSHFGSGRAAWITEVAEEVRLALQSGVPVRGICLYPIIDRPDWEDACHWHNSGLWDLRLAPDGTLERILCEEYARAVQSARRVVPIPETDRRSSALHAVGTAAQTGPAEDQ